MNSHKFQNCPTLKHEAVQNITFNCVQYNDVNQFTSIH